ncbi:MAG: hypothetical protein J6A89_08170 [Clostridia bacterium]|nr:hypothetical protein [Clostridia bacterium]
MEIVITSKYDIISQEQNIIKNNDVINIGGKDLCLPNIYNKTLLDELNLQFNRHEYIPKEYR